VYRTAHMGDLAEDLGSSILEVRQSASSIAADVHHMSQSVDKWAQIITGILVGFGVAWGISKAVERSRR